MSAPAVLTGTHAALHAVAEAESLPDGSEFAAEIEALSVALDAYAAAAGLDSPENRKAADGVDAAAGALLLAMAEAVR